MVVVFTLIVLTIITLYIKKFTYITVISDVLTNNNHFATKLNSIKRYK